MTIATKRNIDFDGLRSLRDRHGAFYKQGTSIYIEGAASAEFYVILQGRVRLSKAVDPGGGHDAEQVELALLGPGDFFGEMAAFTGRRRSARATALEDTYLLYFDQETAIHLLRASPRFSLGIIQTLCDRLQVTDDLFVRLLAEIDATSKTEFLAKLQRERAEPPARGAAPATARAPTPPSAAPEAGIASGGPAVAFNADAFELNPVACPMCGNGFNWMRPKDRFSKVVSRDSDFHERRSGAHPLIFSIAVCPKCGFAALPDDLDGMGESEKALAAAALPNTAELQRLDFRGGRSPEMSELSFLWAIACYEARGADDTRIAELYHRLGWLAREHRDMDKERKYLRMAIDRYKLAVESKSLAEDTELIFSYLIGDLAFRVGGFDDSVRWFVVASQHPGFRRNAELVRLTRERWILARDEQKKAQG